jgi:hypothetical protein
VYQGYVPNAAFEFGDIAGDGRCLPLPTFMNTGVVFMTFWQGLAISVLGQTIDAAGGDPEAWAAKSQNFLICLEMLLFSLAHYYCFPTDEWQENYKVNYQKMHLGDSIALGDFFSDLKLLMSKKKSHKKKKIQRVSSQPTVAEGDEENDDDDATADEENVYDDATAEYDSDDQNDDASLSTTVSAQSGDKAEVDEAQQRLSKFLDDMAFTSYTSPDVIEVGKDKAGPGTPGKTPMNQNVTPKASGGVATETTGLLSARSPSLLKPSVFTTVADIAEKSISSKDEEKASC